MTLTKLPQSVDKGMTYFFSHELAAALEEDLQLFSVGLRLQHVAYICIDSMCKVRALLVETVDCSKQAIGRQPVGRPAKVELALSLVIQALPLIRSHDGSLGCKGRFLVAPIPTYSLPAKINQNHRKPNNADF